MVGSSDSRAIYNSRNYLKLIAYRQDGKKIRSTIVEII